MNKYSKLSKEQMLEILNIVHPNTKWSFNQELDNDGNGTDTCIEFLGDDTSCAQFNIDQDENDSLRFYYEMEKDFEKSERDGEIMLENATEKINDYLGIEGTNKTPQENSPQQKIKNHYLIKGEEDKFTKTTEYQTKYINFKSDLVDNYMKSLSDFGIGSALINFSLLYRKKGESDVCLIEIKIIYITLDDYFANPKILKDLNIIFLADDEPIEVSNQTAYDFGKGEYTGYEEIGLLSIGIDTLIKICSSNKLEFRMSGSKGVFLEKTVDQSTMYSIKGFYNALFDQDYEVEYLLEGIEKQNEEDRKKEAERKKKDAERKKKEIKTNSSNSNCFVVTATMGDIHHPIVTDFRTFRDERLLTNFLGRQFVSFYYIIGPFFASVIRKNENLRDIVFRKFIRPLHDRITDDNK